MEIKENTGTAAQQLFEFIVKSTFDQNSVRAWEKPVLSAYLHRTDTHAPSPVETQKPAQTNPAR